MTAILHVAGYSNSGKTTFIEKMISKCVEEGLAVATIKHHGHGKKLKALDEGKDSWRHRQAGALATAVTANETLQLQMTKIMPWTVDELLPFYEHLSLDLIMIEGYKKERFPKIVFVRTKEQLGVLSELENIQAVIIWPELGKDISFSGPVFYINDEEDQLNWLLEFCKNSKGIAW